MTGVHSSVLPGSWGGGGRDALEGGEVPPLPPPGRPAYAQLLSPWRHVPASMAFVTDSNRHTPTRFAYAGVNLLLLPQSPWLMVPTLGYAQDPFTYGANPLLMPRTPHLFCQPPPTALATSSNRLFKRFWGPLCSFPSNASRGRGGGSRAACALT